MLIITYPLFFCSLLSVTLSHAGNKLKDISLKSLCASRMFLEALLYIIALTLYVSGVTRPGCHLNK